MKLFLGYFLVFFIYSVIGWIVETVYVSVKSKKVVNRGFLIGPYCPIYGYGALGMILYLEQYKGNILTVFVLGMVICCVLEYLTSYIMEILFNTRWWDYSNRKFNLNGRICGENALLFGSGGVIIIYLVHPFLKNLLYQGNETILLIISVVCLVVFLGDTILSLNVMHRLKYTLKQMELKKDSTQEISKLVRDNIHNRHVIFQERLFSAFPNIDFKKLVEFKEDIKDEIKELLKK